MTSFTLLLNDMFKVSKNVWVKMIKSENYCSYSESGPDSNFSINSASNFDYSSKSNSESESDFSSVFMNLDICIFLFYICIPLNKPADGFFLSILVTESIVIQAMKV